MKSENNKFLEKAYFKFNNGNGAKLCNHCNKIIKLGFEFNENEKKAFRGEIYLEPEYCKDCTKIHPIYRFNKK